ncbi:heterokaryon incompatibility protein-domain-containing protein [Podospora conica]|nr:heterokaryon incompatibility protein-domain-containing protein [Schizothecium conicum]
MRLLKTAPGRPEFQDFLGDEIPLYAILSHTWGRDEVSYQEALQYDIERLSTAAGFKKIDETRAVAALHGFGWVWIDTCCIDKTSSAELSEAINSMYLWYQQSAICYAYLSDVEEGGDESFAASRWFTRGWTLQELIAPEALIFFDKAWKEIGTKALLSQRISAITGISQDILKGLVGPDDSSIAQRMSWASQRETTRVEDMAYCLMGLFGVNMPMLYGEGKRAFLRLQEEIIKTSNDHSIFAWKSPGFHPCNFLAESPSCFADSNDIVPTPNAHAVGDIIINNKGIHLDVETIDLPHPIRRSWNPSQPRLERVCVYQSRQMLVRPCNFALAKAAEPGNERIFRLIMEKGSLESPRMLLRAAESGHAALAKVLLNSGVIRDIGDPREVIERTLASGHNHVAELISAALREALRTCPKSRSRTPNLQDAEDVRFHG